MLKYNKLAKIMLFACLIVLILSFVLSTYFPYTKTKTKNIEFQEYNQSLVVNSESYVDVITALPIGKIVQTETYGVVELSSTDVGYFTTKMGKKEL